MSSPIMRTPRIMLVLVTLAVTALAAAAPAFAEGPTFAHWHLEGSAAPRNLPLAHEGVAGEGQIIVTASNLGDADMHGETSTITIKDTLPKGVEASAVPVLQSNTFSASKARVELCAPLSGEHREISCTYKSELSPYEQLELVINVNVTAEAAFNPINTATVEGGGAASPNPLQQPLEINGAETHFGVEAYEQTPETEEFGTDTQAGSHPFQLTTTLDLNEVTGLEPPAGGVGKDVLQRLSPAPPRDFSFKLPAGMIGDVNAAPTCSDIDFGAEEEEGIDACPNEDAVGVAAVTYVDPTNHTGQLETRVVPVFNLSPSPGEPARFGFSVIHVPVVLDTSVRTGEDYGVTVSVHNASQAVQVLTSKVTFWGMPGDKRHNESRGWSCLNFGLAKYREVEEPCNANYAPTELIPFLTLPTKCQSLATPMTGLAWDGEQLETPDGSKEVPETSAPLSSEHCASLPFGPIAEVIPDQQSASTPTGLTVKVKSPQTTTLEPIYDQGTAEADVGETNLVLPLGMMASSGAANGLETCSVGAAGFTHGGEGDKEAVLESDLNVQSFTPVAASCPESAKVGTVDIRSPDLKEDLTGGLYLAAQDTDPFAMPLAFYIIAKEKTSEVLVKLVGEVHINPETGQLSSDFRDTPQAPFEELTLHLWDGGRASQATPATCGTYVSKATFTNSSNGAQVVSEPSFAITSGPHGSPCPNATPSLETGFHAASTNAQAGAYSPFKLTIERPDGNAALKTISMTLPQGLAAKLQSVPLCPEPQASEGNCPEASLIGKSMASSGLGETPYRLPGKVYLTGPYKTASGTAPFGLSSVTEATAGPFHLGKDVVRSGITVNELTAAATINTAASQFFAFEPTPGEQATAEGLPESIKGIPSQIKKLEVEIERPEFEFNPTNCEPQAVTGQITGYNGAAAQNVSSPFKISNCAGLPFAPKLTATVSGPGSKVNGTAFAVTVESPGLGQANIHKVDLTIPAVLPSRLTTIQKACLEAVFNANPASCDEGSVIGEGTVYTPVFKNPLKGPAYLVSHGNAAFPDVEFVLQGEGITLILDGKTDIKKGVTYSRFETSPDAPFTKFVSTFPAGPHSALTANVPESEDFNLCAHAKELVIPTEMTAQNGAFIPQQTQPQLTGCGAGVASFVTGKTVIKKHSIKGSTLTLVVFAPGAGKISISGSGLHGLKKSVSKAGSYTIKVKLTAKGKTAVAHKHQLKMRVRDGFTPSHGNASSASVTVKFH
jgi:hypothetical protein